MTTVGGPSITSNGVRPTGGPAAPLAVGGAIAACCVGLAIWNPGDHGMPLCPTKAVTGIDCPFCGGLRAMASLGRGNVARAADHNLLLVLIAPVAFAWWLMWLNAARIGRPAPRPNWTAPAVRRTVAALVVVTLAFTVIRNIKSGGHRNFLASEIS